MKTKKSVSLNSLRSLAVGIWIAVSASYPVVAQEATSSFPLIKFNVDEYLAMENPNGDEFFRADILTEDKEIYDMGGLFAILPAGNEVPYHYHEERESVIFAIAGEAIQVMEGEEFDFVAGDIIVIPPQTKHQTINRSNEQFRYVEFFTNPPVMSDFHLVE
ncbi:MAG: cupin domain-containing protein [Porticoccaceae bacterium]|jgi:mannose-6-phosphate isomerase-like protein (cupin superfamily)|nr:cupin domain-containing protein [Porticoccaceae bacterium]